MKLVIQIPAYNEEAFLGPLIADIRANIPSGFSDVEIVVINDGSTDQTADVARQMNVQHIVDLGKHCGLGVAFKKGLEYSLKIGADIIVNTDADMQYRSDEIKRLVPPILEGKADIVVGDRRLTTVPRYPVYKLISQLIGSVLISGLNGRAIKDATSGFRAISKDTARLLIEHMTNPYTYTAESLCILLNARRRIAFVPIHIRESVRPSRLIKSKIYYVKNYLFTVFSYFLKRF